MFTTRHAGVHAGPSSSWNRERARLRPALSACEWTTMTSPAFPEPPPSVPATLFADVDSALQKLSSRKDAWARLGIPERMRYLEAIKSGVLDVAQAWVDAGCRAKGISDGSLLAGEEWFSGPMTVV